MKIVVAIALICISLVGVMAQSTPKVDERQQRQQKRIDEGVKSGELTKKEAVKAEKRQNQIANQEAEAKADGKVTRKERRKLHRAQNRASKKIYEQKHDSEQRK